MFVIASILSVLLNTQNCALSDNARSAISTASQRYSIDAHLLEAIAFVESTCNERAVSNAGAVGLMQVMPREIGRGFEDRPTRAQLYDVRINVNASAKTLAYMRDVICAKYEPRADQTICALGAYYGGTQVYYSHRLKSYEQAYASKVLRARGVMQ